MECDIYKSSSENLSYIFVEAGASLVDKVPKDILMAFGDSELIKTIHVNENSEFISSNPKEIIESINLKNYYIKRTSIAIKQDSVSEAGAALGGGILAASLGFGPLGAIFAAVAGYVIANAAKDDNSKGGSDDANS